MLRLDEKAAIVGIGGVEQREVDFSEEAVSRRSRESAAG